MQTEDRNLHLAIINDGDTYARRSHLAHVSFSRPVMSEYLAIVRAQADKERADFGTKYKIAEIKAAARIALECDRQHALECMRDKVAAGEAVYARGRKWFDNTYGNTYHSVTLNVAGTGVYIPMQYGYGEQWKTSAIEWLVKNGIFEDARYENGNRDHSTLYALVQWGDCPEGLKRDL